MTEPQPGAHEQQDTSNEEPCSASRAGAPAPDRRPGRRTQEDEGDHRQYCCGVHRNLMPNELATRQRPRESFERPIVG